MRPNSAIVRLTAASIDSAFVTSAATAEAEPPSLPMMAAVDVVAEVRRYAPAAVIVACADGVRPAVLRSAGASGTYARGAPPDRIAAVLRAGDVAAAADGAVAGRG